MDSPLSTPNSQRAARNRGAERSGFALLITITLLAFLVILLVGLATYTRVETAVAGNTQRQAQARQNALVGLNLAVAQLQKYAGPDTRVTATAESFPSVNSQKRRYTGVWHSDPAATADTTTPLAWLVSGVETGATADVTQAIPAASRVALTGPKTDGSTFLANGNPGANNVVAPLQSITAPGVPGVNGTPVIGRYAWWVGDQGVKASVAVPDASAAVNYAPWDSADQRARIRQQIALGAGAATAAGAPVFEPRDANNASLVAAQKVVATNQLAFLRNSANAPIGLTAVQQNFFAWSPGNFAVLANTKTGGLREDLSLAPGRLGSAFVAWANYPAYTESFTPAAPPADGTVVTPTVPAINPAYGSDPLRRRYTLTPANADAGIVNSVAPVLTFFGLSFSVRESASAAPLMEVATRCVVTLWNPYTGALVPEHLRVEITGLPEIRVEDSAGGNHPIDLQETMAGSFGAPFRLYLPWTPEKAKVDQADMRSWLPGRVYSWAATENFSEPAEGNGMVFHVPDSIPPTVIMADDKTVSGGQGIVRATSVHHHTFAPGDATPLTRLCRSTGPATIQIRVLRASNDTVLATYRIAVDPFGPTAPIKIDNKFVDFAIVRRMPETNELPTGATDKWLSAPGRDPRTPDFPAAGLIGGVNGEDPALYGGNNITGFVVRNAQRLLDRAGNAYAYNEDVPVFELPRAPLLSLGQLQHLHLADVRPFSVGNPWSAAAQINGIPALALFDRYFFSGLVDGVTPGTTAAGEMILPNPLLKPLRKRDSTRVTIGDVRALMAPPTTADTDGNGVAGPPASALSSKFFLQGGAFNVNSVNVAAWAAVLRGVRFPAPQSFAYLNASASTGTAADTTQSTVQSTDAQFFRFPQSAQETYRADPGLADSGADPAVPSPANTHLFRRGMRTLTAAQVGALAAKIAELVTAKQTTDGPFRSLEEFLSPSALFSGAATDPALTAPRSLLEAAITDTGINSDIAEFSSQFLTQADVMTALAPVLFPRSDTFVVRAYGEAVNPATATTAGRAWCEAIVQRVPEYFDPNPTTGDAPEIAPAALSSASNRANGRRFKIISFRWLTRSDL